MSPSSPKIFEFGPFRLDASERVLLRDGRPVPLTLKAFDLLMLLVENNGHIVEKDVLMNRVWSGSFVEEGNLKVTISMLRKALEDNQDGNRFIETVPRRGYRFVAEVNQNTQERADLFVHERTRESITIDELPVTAGKSQHGRRVYVFGLALVMLATITGFVLVKNRNRMRGLNANPAPIKSIAVLPFKPLVADNRDESLELGIAETLITRLSSSRAINVSPTAAVRRYARLDQDPIAAGRELHVEAILDGSLQRVGDRLRVTVRLIRVENGEILWTERFDEKITDIFSLEDRIAERLVSSLPVKLTSEQHEMLVKHSTENSQAYQLYLQGNYSSRREERLTKSLEYYEEATRLDPSYALAYARLADAYTRLALQEYLRPLKSFPKAKAAAIKALELDDKIMEAHITLGSYWLDYEWNASAAEREFKRALELDPDSSWAHSAYGTLLRKLGQFEEAAKENKRSAELWPTNAAERSNVGWVYFYAGKYEEAISHYKQALDLNPRFPWAHLGISRAYFQLRRYDDAAAALKDAVTFSEGNVRTIAALGHQYAMTGKEAEARKVLGDLEELSKRKYVSPYFIAVVYAGLGDREQTFNWLEQAFAERHPSMTNLAREPYFDRVRADRRFTNLRRRVGLP